MGSRLRAVAGNTKRWSRFSKAKASVGTGGGRCRAVILEAAKPCLQSLNPLWLQSVIDPATPLPIHEQTGLLENAEVKRQFRLSELEFLGEITDAPFTHSKADDNPLAMGVCQRFEQQAGLFGI